MNVFYLTCYLLLKFNVYFILHLNETAFKKFKVKINE